MAWVTNAAVRKAVKSVLGMDPAGSLPAHWDELIESGTEEGYQHVRAALAARGYTDAQLATWAAREVWNRTAALYHVLHDAALDEDRLLAHLEHLAERLKGLATLTLVDDDGALLTPPAGRCGYGDQTDGDDRHTMDDEL